MDGSGREGTGVGEGAAAGAVPVGRGVGVVLGLDSGLEGGVVRISSMDSVGRVVEGVALAEHATSRINVNTPRPRMPRLHLRDDRNRIIGLI